MRDSESIAGPYSKCRDWRNQLRTNTEIEILRKHHPSKKIRERGPVYQNEDGERVLYVITSGNSLLFLKMAPKIVI